MVDLAFIVFFFLELVLRLAVHRLYFFINYNAGWNLLDFTLVVLSLLELTVSWSSGRDTNGTVTYLRVLRLLKFARILRSLKVITAFRELAMMLESFRSCLAAMFWSLILLIFLVFLCALLFAQGVADALQAQQAPPELLDLVMETFGSVLKTMLSLYMAVTGGNDWSMYYGILESLGSFYHLIFIITQQHRSIASSRHFGTSWVDLQLPTHAIMLFPFADEAYTFFFAFAIFNILTGIFVERAVAASLPDREQQILLERRKLLEQANELRDLFSCMDLDDSGNISLEEFLCCMKDPRIVAYMSSVGVSVHDVQHLFKIVANENDEVDIDRFVDGCMAIKGSATALDMQKQLYYIQELSRTLQTWERILEADRR
ncbi:Sodium channel protein type 11 subunit alpha (NaN) (Sensory neuron sodium channel 2) (Sodium channel protein type XI subunit alpha) (Voltage-gated sodium channel subunit alpha Nav1.9) [Durusdinium trenchii]|uniref:Sodium channel protein type 11 subunit alpha (NaN) (Sensory neuron sodium channel 2) (Sodium channel protein type XI subunit alpha) (Voltage-gated sodium channel subunit alpha Nav1.9) n=1 Tax=Durusdinium trenchii TaxID=1381693 RepID=A0ABP0SBA9_9DINO